MTLLQLQRICCTSALLLLAPLVVSGSCGLTWYPPSNHFDGVNERGNVSYWEQVDTIDFGDGLVLPIIINFRSDREASSSILGEGWLIAILESSIYQIDERNFLMVEPDGTNRYFNRADSESRVLKDRGGWAAEIKNDDTITAWAECGWRLTFRRGKLVTMQTPENRQIDFVYSDGHVSEIHEGGKCHLKLITNISSGRATSLEFNERAINVEFSKRPIVQTIAGNNIVTGTSFSLHKLMGAHSGPHEYNFAVNDITQPTLTITGKPDRVFTWDPATHHIMLDTGWKYTIKPGSGTFYNAEIRRTKDDGGMEYWYDDKEHGTETSQGLDGVQTVTNYFVSGLLAGKVRSIRQITDGKSKSIITRSYTEQGKLFRETDADAIATVLTYDERNRVHEIVRDGIPLAQRTYDDKNRVVEEEIYGVQKVTYVYQDDGGYKKTTLRNNGSKDIQSFDSADDPITPGNHNEKVPATRDNGEANLVVTDSEKRNVLIRDLSLELKQAQDSVVKGDLLIRIGRIYIADELGPIEVQNAVKVFEQLTADPSMDAYTKAQAYGWLFSIYNERSYPDKALALSSLKKVMELSSDKLTGIRKARFEEGRAGTFRALLSMIETDRPKENQRLWNNLLNKYGASPELTGALATLYAQEKCQLALRYFNNY